MKNARQNSAFLKTKPQEYDNDNLSSHNFIFDDKNKYDDRGGFVDYRFDNDDCY